nr:MAG TPA: hypothetical protein [Caudoviricetes sp.]
MSWFICSVKNIRFAWIFFASNSGYYPVAWSCFH